MSFVSKISALVYLLSCVLVLPTVAHAQDVQEMPMTLLVSDVSVDPNTGEILVDFSLENNTNILITDLSYIIELHQGTALRETGYVFEDLRFVTYTQGTLEELIPYEKTFERVSFTPPSTIETGSYFIRVFVMDKDENYFGVDHTDTPIVLSGSGEYVGPIYTKFRTSHGDDMPMEGWLVQSDETPSIVIPVESNKKLFSTLNTQSLFANSTVYPVNGDDTDTPVYVYESVALQSEPLDDGNVILPLPPFPGIKSGPYEVVTTIVNEQGVPVAEKIFSRWLVDGFTARLAEIETGTNIYQKGDRIDLVVSVAEYGSTPGQKGRVTATFSGVGFTTELQKEFVFEDTARITFADEKAKQEMRPTSLTVTLTDLASGSVIDVFQKDITQVSEYSRDVTFDRSMSVIVFGVSLAILVLLVVYVRIRNKKHAIPLAIILVGTVIAQALLLSASTDDVRAEADEPTTLSWYSSSFPSGNKGTCPQTVSPNTYVRPQCGTCLNGVSGSGEIAGSDFTLSALGHVYSWKSPMPLWGPFAGSVTVNDADYSKSYNASASVGDGAHCMGTSITSSTYTVSCTPTPINGTCGSATGVQTSSQPTMNLCNTGEYKIQPVTPFMVPGKIEAEWYTGYYDKTAGQQDGAIDYYAPNDDVDLDKTTDTGGGYYVGWTQQNEWLSYNISVPETGIYTINARVASVNNSRKINFKVDNVDVGTVTYSSSGGWQKWKTVTLSGINLTQGNRTLRVTFTTGGQNLNYIELTSATVPTPTPTNPTWNWQCIGRYGGTTASCSAPNTTAPVNGQCGTASSLTPIATEPTTNPAACNPGTYRNEPADTGDTYRWTCDGLNSGDPSTTCSAPIYVDVINGACGSAHNTTVDEQPSGSAACSAGTPVLNSPADTATLFRWSCLGQNGGNDATNCQATNDNPPASNPPTVSDVDIDAPGDSATQPPKTTAYATEGEQCTIKWSVVTEDPLGGTCYVIDEGGTLIEEVDYGTSGALSVNVAPQNKYRITCTDSSSGFDSLSTFALNCNLQTTTVEQ